MSRRSAARKAIARLWNCDPANSEEEQDTDQEHLRSDDESCDDSDSGSNDQSVSSDSDTTDTNVPNCTSKDGTSWTKIENFSTSGRLPSRNIFTKSPGIKPFAKSKIDSELSAWRLLFTPKMMKILLECTIEKGKEKIADYCLTFDELEAFIGLFLHARSTVSK